MPLIIQMGRDVLLSVFKLTIMKNRLYPYMGFFITSLFFSHGYISLGIFSGCLCWEHTIISFINCRCQISPSDLQGTWRQGCSRHWMATITACLWIYILSDISPGLMSDSNIPSQGDSPVPLSLHTLDSMPLSRAHLPALLSLLVAAPHLPLDDHTRDRPSSRHFQFFS